MWLMISRFQGHALGVKTIYSIWHKQYSIPMLGALPWRHPYFKVVENLHYHISMFIVYVRACAYTIKYHSALSKIFILTSLIMHNAFSFVRYRAFLCGDAKLNKFLTLLSRHMTHTTTRNWNQRWVMSCYSTRDVYVLYEHSKFKFSA